MSTARESHTNRKFREIQSYFTGKHFSSVVYYNFATLSLVNYHQTCPRVATTEDVVTEGGTQTRNNQTTPDSYEPAEILLQVIREAGIASLAQFSSYAIRALTRSFDFTKDEAQ